MNGICAIVLAAGESKRMNTPKLLLPIAGKTMIEMVIGNVLQAEIDFTLVVLGSFAKEISETIGHLPVTTCFNENYREGMLSSVKCGFENLPGKFDAILVFQGDQPFIDPDVTGKVITAYRDSGKGLVIPVYKGKRGHPLLIGFKYRTWINRIPDNEGLRWLAATFPGDVLEVDTSSGGILKDFDTIEDYLNETNKYL
ncbi:MAG TPA: nucleotidyltransferase family protein [Bacteroidales bacterium]|jgi:molybdenum cofactor cytidylyltransferase|nr:nucleotidyltransferase family protein [Bacteroidales bacterium]